MARTERELAVLQEIRASVCCDWYALSSDRVVDSVELSGEGVGTRIEIRGRKWDATVPFFLRFDLYRFNPDTGGYELDRDSNEREAFIQVMEA